MLCVDHLIYFVQQPYEIGIIYPHFTAKICSLVEILDLSFEMKLEFLKLEKRRMEWYKILITLHVTII